MQTQTTLLTLVLHVLESMFFLLVQRGECFDDGHGDEEETGRFLLRLQF